MLNRTISYGVHRPKAPTKENSKSEYRKKPRGPKQTETVEAESEKWKSETSWFGISCFSITWIYFEFRISSFEFFLCFLFLGVLCVFARVMLIPMLRFKIQRKDLNRFAGPS